MGQERETPYSCACLRPVFTDFNKNTKQQICKWDCETKIVALVV